MPTMTGGQALVESLKREGVTTIFGLPGVQLDWAFDALYAERENIRVIHTRHEEVAAAVPHGAFGRALRDALPDDGIVVALREAFATPGPTLIEVPVGAMPYPGFLRRVVAGLLRRTVPAT
jgi:thiamine pyrophosphate-dependent acetolactate synthase large subunit-like protein